MNAIDWPGTVFLVVFVLGFLGSCASLGKKA
jgi:hypothetical protein